MRISIKKRICESVAWMAFMILLGIVFGVEKGWSDIKAMWWCLPCLLVWAGGLYKAGWIRW